MNQEDIIRMAREAGLLRVGDGWTEPARWGEKEVQRFAELVAAKNKREWVGLTDEEVAHIADSEWEEAFVRLVEAKLKEKNT